MKTPAPIIVPTASGGTGTLPINGATQADPAAPPANNLTLYAQDQAGAGTPAALKVRDALGQPYWLQAAYIQGRKIATSFLASADAQDPTGSALSALGGGIAGYGYTTAASAPRPGDPTTFPWRDCISVQGLPGTNQGAVFAIDVGVAFGAGQGSIFLRVLAGFTNPAASITGTCTGLKAQPLAIGAVMATTLMDGIYFFRAPATNGGNWSISSDNGAARSANVNTGIAFTPNHIYELLFYLAAGSTTVEWMVNDLTAGTTASGSFAATVTSGANRDFYFDVLDTSPNPVLYCGAQLERDARVA